MHQFLTRYHRPLARLLACALCASLGACSKANVEDSSNLREAGLPATLEELNAWYPAVPDAENAALEYASAGSAHHDPAPALKARLPVAGDAKLPDPNVPLTQDMRAAIGEYLSTNDIALSRATRAATMPASRAPIDLTQGVGVEIPLLAQLRALTRLQCLKAIARAESGNADESFGALREAMFTAQAVKMEPLLISQLVRVACHAIVAQAAERVVSRVAMSEEQLAKLQQTAASLEDPDMMFRALVGERCLMATEFAKPASEATKLTDGAETFPKEMYAPDARRALLEQFDIILVASRLPSAERHRSLEPLTVEHEGSGLSVESIARASANASVAHDVDTAVIRSMVCGLALERYRLVNKAWPDSLAALVPKFLPAVPEDPFGEQPLRYKRDGDTATVYSLGRDRNDDRGRPYTTDGTSTPEGDMVFRCYP